MIRVAIYCAALACAFFVSSAAAQSDVQPISLAALDRFTFAVIGQEPYGPDAAPTWARTQHAVSSSDARFIVHAGDFKSTDEPCSDELFKERLALLDSSTVPLVYVVGGNEWVGCTSVSGGRFDATERLLRLRDLFFAEPASLGRERLILSRESDVARFRGFPENVRWQVGQVMFVGLNLPGGNDDFRPGAGRNGEFEDRVVANRFWLERAFHLAKLHKSAGVVVVVSGDPAFGLGIHAPDRRSNRRDGYFEFKLALRDQVAAFKGQVLLIHEGGPGFRQDQPLTDSSGKVLRNLVRVESFGAASSGNWVRVEVDPKIQRIFTTTVVSADPLDDAASATRKDP